MPADMQPRGNSSRARRRRRAASTPPSRRSAATSGDTESRPDPTNRVALPAWSSRPLAAGFALCALIAVGYYPALWAGFIWDDAIWVDDPAIRAWSGLWNIWFSPDDIEREPHYWPMMYTMFWLEHKLWGFAPFGYHLVNVLLYMVNVLLLWRLLRLLAVPGAWAVAAVFAVHPMHVESVAWLIGRKDLLCGLFCMAATLCWIRSEGAGDLRPDSGSAPAPKRPPLSPSPGWRWPFDSIGVPRPGLYLAALALLAAAMLSKTAAVTLPAAFLIVLWWKRGRVTWMDMSRIAPFFLVALGIAVADLLYYQAGREHSFDYGFLDRVLIAARALWFYAGKLVWPTDLAVIYPLWDIDPGDPLAWGYLVAAVAVAAVLLRARRRLGRGAIAGAAFFALTLSPVLGFVNFGYMGHSLVADRYAYLAGIGVLAVLVGAAALGAGRLPNLFRTGLSVALVAVLAVCGKLTWDQAGIYRDEIAFFSHILSLNPMGGRTAHENLARALIFDSRPAEALAVSRVAIAKRPDSVEAHNALGVSLSALNRLDEAEMSFRRAAELDANDEKSRHNVAEIQSGRGHFEEAIDWYREALAIDPRFTVAHVGLGDALLRLDRYEEAIETYRRALEIEPERPPVHADIGEALYRLQRYDEAVESLARSVALEPESPAAADRHVVMGRASLELGDAEAAARHYRRALAIDPRHAKALDSFAVMRFLQERYDEALGLFAALIEIDEANAQAHFNMGAALYNLDRREQAARSFQRALTLDPTLSLSGFEGMDVTPGRSAPLAQ